jgi:hypothetical protein
MTLSAGNSPVQSKEFLLKFTCQQLYFGIRGAELPATI